MVGYLTRVSLGRAPGGTQVCLRFGITVKQTTCPRTAEILAFFVPNTVFCLAHTPCGVRRANLTRIAVLRAVAPGESCSEIPGVLPGAEILLRATDPVKVEKLLALLMAIEAQHVRPDSVSLDYWRTVHNRLSANIDLVPFNVEAHVAGAQRRRLSI